MGSLTEIRYFDVLPGANIGDVIDECMTKARMNDWIVKIEFNGVKITIDRFIDRKALTDYYIGELEANR